MTKESRMTDQKRQTLVFRDAEGALYALPLETLVQHRVSEQVTAELEQCMSARDVTGFGIEISGGNTGLQLLGQWNLHGLVLRWWCPQATLNRRGRRTQGPSPSMRGRAARPGLRSAYRIRRLCPR